ncbi:hypothetical protein U9M48_037042 [Paspalum notatum var. saurae]|uniref:Protein FAR1-RELATED SEQUENCE n=1 Tax=Paspalum notatum var. saurae TaxID=547442 RepID=A0AAQ3UKC5_PASNO
MFVGANHHLECIVFAFTFLGDKTVETFEWVFNAFKTACSIVISNQDPAMLVALRRVFPNTIHVLCLCHVQNRYMLFLNELYARFEEEDFKSRNGSLLFSKPDYCALMVSTQRSESMNKLVKSAHVDANTPLHEFLSK